MKILDAEPRPDPAVAARFHMLARRWKAETEFLSTTHAFMHPDYQQIIGMGSPGVPLLLRDLAASGAHWF